MSDQSSSLDPSTVPAPPPSPVVVGFDGSRWGRAALFWAADHAVRTGSELDVWTWGETDDEVDDLTSGYPALRVRLHRAGPDPVRDLEAASLRAGTLVVGYQGRSTSPLGLDGLVLALVDVAACDTVIVRGEDSALRGAHQRVTVLVSGGEDDAQVLVRAAAVLGGGSVLRVVHAIPLHTAGDALVSNPQFVLDHAAHLLDELEPRPSYATTLLRFHPHEAIGRETDSDLLVVGSGDHHDLTGRCGSVTKAAVHHASCPVLIVRRPPSRIRLEASQ
ncbi:universal stress protein [Umezawaea sp. Da 62-37]|uniref:universal stress protein n=1 Tax=Umezawaea sp. Da 62-37 TaxID=3075927 RepID=UPI0028F738DD|nr:universal stress protein [Umezawaea sp. Da 62-37]WNV84797.1 universal stress protein [Umezawaea sp. Da 62-37]